MNRFFLSYCFQFLIYSKIISGTEIYFAVLLFFNSFIKEDNYTYQIHTVMICALSSCDSVFGLGSLENKPCSVCMQLAVTICNDYVAKFIYDC